MRFLTNQQQKISEVNPWYDQLRMPNRLDLSVARIKENGTEFGCCRHGLRKSSLEDLCRI